MGTALGARRPPPMSSPAEHVPLPPPEPLDAQLEALEQSIRRAEHYFQKRLHAERCAAAEFEARYARMGAAEGRMLDVEEQLVTLGHVGLPAARELLALAETVGAQLSAERGPMQGRIAQSFGGGLMPRQGPQLTVAERLALKLGI